MLPAKLKNFNLFNDASSYMGTVGEITLPKITAKMEGWRGGGMLGEVKLDMGLDALDLEWKIGGLIRQVLRQFGTTEVDGVLLRFMGAYQAEDGSGVQAVEVVVRGRHEEIDMGNAKPGDDTEWSIKTPCAYYKLVIDGNTEIEIDLIGGVYLIGGVDRYAEIRSALGV